MNHVINSKKLTDFGIELSNKSRYSLKETNQWIKSKIFV